MTLTRLLQKGCSIQQIAEIRLLTLPYLTTPPLALKLCNRNVVTNVKGEAGFGVVRLVFVEPQQPKDEVRKGSGVS